MKTLPKVPQSIPARILDEAKAKGLVYVGVGDERNHIFPKRIDGFFWEVGNEHLVEEYSVNGSSPSWHYFVIPAIAAKYFSLPKKTTQVLTRGAKGRFISPKPPAAQAKKEEKPMVGQVWIDNDNGIPYLIARVALEKVYLFSLRDGNRYYNDPRWERGLKLCPCFAFAANSPAEYFKAKLKA